MSNGSSPSSSMLLSIEAVSDYWDVFSVDWMCSGLGRRAKGFQVILGPTGFPGTRD
jgi:hypothetical protein